MNRIFSNHYIWLGFIVLSYIPFLGLQGFLSDTATFWAWAQRLNEVPLGQFYRTDYFCDYFPLYLYALKIIGFFAKTFNLSYGSPSATLLLKTPSIIAHLVLSALWFRQAPSIYHVEGETSFLYKLQVLSIALCPGVIYNMLGFSQVDVIFCLLVFLLFLSLHKNKLVLSFFWFALVIAFKPLGFLYLPFLGYWFLNQKRVSWKYWFQAIGVFLGTIFLVYAPFWWGRAPAALAHFHQGMTSYPFATVNAFNFYILLGANWMPIDQPTTLGLTVGSLFLCFGVAMTWWFSLLLYQHRRIFSLTQEQLWIVGSMSVVFAFLFLPKMHERYCLIIFPFMFFVALRSRALYFSFVVFSLASTVNQAFIVDSLYGAKNPVSGPIVFACAWMFIVILVLQISEFKKSLTKEILDFDRSKQIFVRPRFSMPNGSNLKATLFLITLSFLSVFTNLGSTDYPRSSTLLTEEFEVNFADMVPAKTIWIYSHGGEGHVFVKCANLPEKDIDISYSWYFAWKETELGKCEKPIKIRPAIVNQKPIGEIAFYDENYRLLEVDKTTLKTSLQNAFDEQKSSLDQRNFYHGTFFDEVYYARAVEEIVSGKYPWENTHPALSKFLMTWWIQATDFNPLNWRVVNAFFGSLIPILIFWFMLNVTGKRNIAVLSAIFAICEWSRISLSRIATIDAMVCFFIVLSFAVTFHTLKKIIFEMQTSNSFKIPFKWLLITSTVLGLSLSLKWNSVFTYISCVSCFLTCFVIAVLQKKQWKKMDLLKLTFCFLVLPFVIYFLTFQPFHFYLKDGYSFSMFLRDQVNMYVYHSTLKATHAFSSAFWTWPFVHKPTWFYSDNYPATGWYRTITIIGNPAVWWMIFPAIFYLAFTGYFKRNIFAFMVLIGFITQYFCWIIASRITFMYHFLPSAIFGGCLISMAAIDLWDRREKIIHRLLQVYGLIVIGLTVLFWPIFTGLPVAHAFVDRFLKWYPGWFF